MQNVETQLPYLELAKIQIRFYRWQQRLAKEYLIIGEPFDLTQTLKMFTKKMFTKEEFTQKCLNAKQRKALNDEIKDKLFSHLQTGKPLVQAA